MYIQQLKVLVRNRFAVNATTLLKYCFYCNYVSFTCSAKSLVTEAINSLALIPRLLGIVYTGGDPLYWANTGTIPSTLKVPFSLSLYLKLSLWGSQCLKAKNWAQKWARPTRPHVLSEEHTKSTQNCVNNDKEMRAGLLMAVPCSCPAQARELPDVFPYNVIFQRRKGNVKWMQLVGNCRGGDRA